jgi:SAM-dependent methyltransferase
MPDMPSVVLEVPPASMRTLSEADYIEQGRKDVAAIGELAPVQASTRVLDVGCAAGRLALPLLGVLDQASGGRYEGFDVRDDRIAWATERITASFPHFRFQHCNVYNQALNPQGTIAGSTFTFPYQSASFDLIVFYSVFTHLLEAEGRQYLAEAARCLSPNGRIYSTWYLWETSTAADIASHDVMWSFPYQWGGNRIQDREFPESAVAYYRDRLLDDINGVGLVVETERRGNWPRARSHGQDILVLRPSGG